MPFLNTLLSLFTVHETLETALALASAGLSTTVVRSPGVLGDPPRDVGRAQPREQEAMSVSDDDTVQYCQREDIVLLSDDPEDDDSVILAVRLPDSQADPEVAEAEATTQNPVPDRIGDGQLDGCTAVSSPRKGCQGSSSRTDSSSRKVGKGDVSSTESSPPKGGEGDLSDSDGTPQKRGWRSTSRTPSKDRDGEVRLVLRRPSPKTSPTTGTGTPKKKAISPIVFCKYEKFELSAIG